MTRVTGIGGIFFKSENPEQLYQWYEKNLGIRRESHGQCATFEWREAKAADGTEPGPEAQTAWTIFPATTKKFGASKAGFMVNYRVDDLDALLAAMKATGVEVSPPEDYADYGRFAWVTDPDGNRIELWEPPKQK